MNKAATFLLPLLFCLFYSDGVSAQEITDKGILVGLNTAQFTSHPISRSQSIRERELQDELGFTVGFFFVFELSQQMGLRSEILYSKAGTRYETFWRFSEQQTRRESSDFTFHYIRIPILLTLDVKPVGQISVGPYFGAAEWTEQSSTESVREDGTQRELDITFGDTFAPFPEIGIVVGGSFTIGRISLSARYFRGNSIPVSHSNQSRREFLPGLQELQFILGYTF